MIVCLRLRGFWVCLMLMNLLSFFQKQVSTARKSRGATTIEYVLIASLIGVVIVAACRKLGGSYSSIYNNIANHLP